MSRRKRGTILISCSKCQDSQLHTWFCCYLWLSVTNIVQRCCGSIQIQIYGSLGSPNPGNKCIMHMHVSCRMITNRSLQTKILVICYTGPYCSGTLQKQPSCYPGVIAQLVCRNRAATSTSAISASQSKTAVSTNIKHSRYIHLMSDFLSIHFHTERLYVHMFDVVDTPFSYGRGLIVLLISSGIFQDKRNYSACNLKCRYCIFTLLGRYVTMLQYHLGVYK